MTAEIEDDYKPMSVKEAIGILSSLQSSQVITALRHTDFVMLAGLAFQGFRMDSGGYANPIVRRRLAEEAARNHQFAEKLRELSKAPPSVQSAPQAASPIRQAVRPPEPDRDAEKYRVERERLKHERDAAVVAKQAAERQLTEAKRDLIAATAAKAEADREIERLKQRVERTERKQRQLETTNAALRRAAVQPPPAPTPPPAPEQPLAAAAPSDEHYFAEAIRHLLGKDRETVALSLVNDVLRSIPDDVYALEIKADALIQTEKLREAVPVLRTLISQQLKRLDIERAATALYKLLMVTSRPEAESRLIQSFMRVVEGHPAHPKHLTAPLAPLRVDRPEAFELVKSLMPGLLRRMSFPEHKTYAPDELLPLRLSAGLAVSSRRLVEAIDNNDPAIIELVQEALRNLDSEEREKVLASVTRASDGDPVYSSVLTPKYSRGAIIVDSSNVAWHGQEMVAHQQPRLDYVLAIRRTLWEKGYFPVHLIADANFPFVINNQAEARKMVDSDQLVLVMGGSDADEHILREAKRLNAPVLTNDYMVDWDPDQAVTKIQYSFTPDGKPTIYW